MPEKPASYYDRIFRDKSWRRDNVLRMRRRLTLPACLVTGDGVLDLGCGLGLLADVVRDREYLGVDFSEIAVRYARKHTRNSRARFLQADIRELTASELGRWDTVVMLEVLEHLQDPSLVVSLAKVCARRRIVVTVPTDMEKEPAHVKGKWTCTELSALFGSLNACEKFKPDKSWVVLGVKEMG